MCWLIISIWCIGNLVNECGYFMQSSPVKESLVSFLIYYSRMRASIHPLKQGSSKWIIVKIISLMLFFG